MSPFRSIKGIFARKILKFILIIPLATRGHGFVMGFAGDIMAHEAVKKTAAFWDLGFMGQGLTHNGYDHFFMTLKELLRESDYNIGNLETPIAPLTGVAESYIKQFAPIFNAPVFLVRSLKRAGFSHLSLANNHSFDQGIPAITETYQNVKDSGIEVLGAREKEELFGYEILEKKGVRVLLIAFSAVFNCIEHIYELSSKAERGSRLINILSTWANPRKYPGFRMEKIAEEIQRLRKTLKIDKVVVTIHWGAEYQQSPTREDSKITRYLFENGVDSIIGHHPHVLSPLEFYRARDGRVCFVIYSIGNFLSAMGRTYHALTPNLDLGKTRDSIYLKIGFEGAPSPKLRGYLEQKGLYPGRNEDLPFRSLEIVPLWVVFERAGSLPFLTTVPVKSVDYWGNTAWKKNMKARKEFFKRLYPEVFLREN